MQTHHAVVFPISLGMVKVFLIKGSHSVLVDTGTPGQTQKILEAISGHGVNPKQLALIVITHAHSDHIGSLAELKAQTGAKVAVHQAEADVLTGKTKQELVPASLFARLFHSFAAKQQAAPCTPDIVLTDELRLDQFGVEGKIVPTPGHTSGSVSVLMDHGEAMVGDLFMGGFVRSQTPHFPFFASDLSQVRTSLMTVLATNPRILHTAHGGPFDPDTVRRRLLL